MMLYIVDNVSILLHFLLQYVCICTTENACYVVQKIFYDPSPFLFFIIHENIFRRVMQDNLFLT